MLALEALKKGGSDIATVANFCTPDREIDIITPLQRLSSGDSFITVELPSGSKMTDEELRLDERFIADIADIIREEMEANRPYYSTALNDLKKVIDCCDWRQQVIFEDKKFFNAIARIVVPHICIARPRRAFD